jgi:sugar phosphate isomerase/epimerase
MRLGGPVPVEDPTPEEWTAALDERGYRAAAVPLDLDADAEQVDRFRQAAAAADVELAEVGAWGANPISDDSDERQAGIDRCVRALELADAVGARCAVSVAGSRGDTWDGPHPDNLTDETFYRVVEAVEEICERADPDDAVFTLEPMPWVYPHDIESHRALLGAIDHDAVGVHFDPVNMITSPERHFDNAAFLREFVAELGEYVEVVHLKDAVLREKLTVHVDEVRPGAGTLDYHVLLSALADLDDDLPLLLEHLESEAAYEQAREYVREVAADVGVTV